MQPIHEPTRMLLPDNDDKLTRSPPSQVSAVFLLLCLLAITAHFSSNQSALVAAESHSGNTLSHWQNDLSLAQPGIAIRLAASDQEHVQPPEYSGVGYLASFPDISACAIQQIVWFYPTTIPVFLAATFYPSQAPPFSDLA